MRKYSDSILTLVSPEELLEVLKNRDIILEIGSGNGIFLEHLAKSHPDKIVLGIELDVKRAKQSKRRIDRNGFSNVYVVSSDAMNIIPLFFPNHCVEKAFMNFPEPWGKEYQWRNRLYELGFMSMIDRITKAGGLFHLATDVEYIYSTVNNILCHVLGNWYLDEKKTLEFKDNFIPTLYYEKWKSEGRNFWWGVWMKRY